MNQTNLIILIKECQANNRAAQERLFTMHYGVVMLVCRRYGRSKEDAKEMLNDTFRTVFKNIGQYDIAYPFGPWLRKTTVNCCLMHIRKYKKNLDIINLKDYIEDKIDAKYDVPDIDVVEYMKLLQHLPDACRLIVNLYVIEEYKHHEIAKALKISVGTSKSQLHRGKKLLYNMLEKDGLGKLKLKTAYGK